VSDVWYYFHNRTRFGPVKREELLTELSRIPNSDNAFVWRDGFSDWMQVSDVAELRVRPVSPPPPPFVSQSTHSVASSPAATPTERLDAGILRTWFSFRGREIRSKYWLVTLTNFVILILAASLPFAIKAEALWIVFLLVLVVFFFSGFAVAARRLHDRNRSAWWILLYIVAPSILSTFGQKSGDPVLAGVLGLTALGVSIAAFIDLGCLRGTVGINYYGPDPLQNERR